MRILLTGGAGYVGTHVALNLLMNGYDVTVLDTFRNSTPESIARVEELTGREVRVIEGDACSAGDLDRALDGDPVAAAVHFADLTSAEESRVHPALYYRNNIGAVLQLTEALLRHDVKTLVYSSTAALYQKTQDIPIVEEAPIGMCTSPYTRSKQFGEQILSDIALTNPNLHAVILRYYTPVGAHSSGAIGEDPSHATQTLMTSLCKVATGELEWLSIYGNDYETQDGTIVQDYIHVLDLAEGYLMAIHYALAHVGVEIFNLGTGRGYSALEMALSFARVNGVEIPYRFGPRQPQAIASYYLDPSKAKRLLGWKARRTLEDMCADTWRWRKNNPIGYQISDSAY